MPDLSEIVDFCAVTYAGGIEHGPVNGGVGPHLDGVADGDFIFACLIEGIGELRGLGLAGFQGILLAAHDLAVDLEFGGAGSGVVADIDHIGLDVQHIAVHVAHLTVSL